MNSCRRAALALALSIGLVLASAGSAWGSLLPGSLDFGDQPVGVPSAPRNATLDPGSTCVGGGPFGDFCFPNIISPSLATTGPFSQTSDCQLIISSPCTVGVVFKPTSAGPATGTLTSGTSSVLLKGTGTARNASGGNGGGGQTLAQGTGKHKKKCKHHKKGHKRVLLRKCHKHHHGKHHA
jgi:hypothetical protein